MKFSVKSFYCFYSLFSFSLSQSQSDAYLDFMSNKFSNCANVNTNDTANELNHIKHAL